MTRSVCCVGPHQVLDECMALGTRNCCRHLPVLPGRQLINLVSIGCPVKVGLAEKDFAIDQLSDHIRVAS